MLWRKACYRGNAWKPMPSHRRVSPLWSSSRIPDAWVIDLPSDAGRPGEFHFGDDRFADSANRVRIPPRIRQEPARRFSGRARRDVVPVADPLNRGRRPSPGRVAGAAAGRRDRPFQGRRDLAQGPTENPAAPDQHHHLVIMLADQFPDPLTGRITTGSGVDFPASWHDSRHDTTPT